MLRGVYEFYKPSGATALGVYKIRRPHRALLFKIFQIQFQISEVTDKQGSDDCNQWYTITLL